MEGKRVVLCGANAYDKKYYFNKDFDGIPDSVKDELHIICVLFTEEVGGIFTFVFEEDGSLTMETDAEEDDIYYDEISSGLLIREIRRNKQEFLFCNKEKRKQFITGKFSSGLGVIIVGLIIEKAAQDRKNGTQKSFQVHIIVR